MEQENKCGREVDSTVSDVDGVKTTITLYDDGAFLVEQELGEPFATYFRLSEEIKSERDIEKKLAACEASFEILPAFVRESLKDSPKLPDTILCRDEAPKLYLRLGRWAQAEAAIKKCRQAGAYDDGGRSALEHLKRYRSAAESALAFLESHAGFLQKDLYKALPDVDRDCLKEFARSSQLIRKVKSGSTNKLYLSR